MERLVDSPNPPLLSLPPELLCRILIETGLDATSIRSLMFTNRHLNAFTRKHGEYLVGQMIQSQDPLAGLLARPLNASYEWFHALRREQVIFDSIKKILQEDEMLYYEGFAPFEERSIVKSSAAWPLLRAGFLIHFHMRWMKAYSDKIFFFRDMALEYWCILSLFTRFLNALLKEACSQKFNRDELALQQTPNYVRCYLFGADFLTETSFYAGLQIALDFINTRSQPIPVEDMTALQTWAFNVGQNYAPAVFTDGKLGLYINDTFLRQFQVPDLEAERELVFASSIYHRIRVMDVHNVTIYDLVMLGQSEFPSDCLHPKLILTVLDRLHVRAAAEEGEVNLTSFLQLFERRLRNVMPGLPLRTDSAEPRFLTSFWRKISTSDKFVPCDLKA